MYSMSCEPLTCCSMEAATDCDTTSALAPGKLVVTVTWGGTTCGYWAIGRLTAASAPTRIMSRAMTVEKTGRSIKKLSMGSTLDDLRDLLCKQDRWRRHAWLSPSFWAPQAEGRYPEGCRWVPSSLP